MEEDLEYQTIPRTQAKACATIWESRDTWKEKKRKKKVWKLYPEVHSGIILFWYDARLQWSIGPGLSFCTFSYFLGREKMAWMMCWFLSKEPWYWCGQVWSKTEDEKEFPKLQSRYKHFNLQSPRKKRAPPIPQSTEPKYLTKTWSCRSFLFKWEQSTFLISRYKQAFHLLLSSPPPPSNLIFYLFVTEKDFSLL